MTLHYNFPFICVVTFTEWKSYKIKREEIPVLAQVYEGNKVKT
jgi:hypothetical protein